LCRSVAPLATVFRWREHESLAMMARTNRQRTQKRSREKRDAEGATRPETLRQKDCVR